MNKKLSTLSVSGLMIGPILGSGIVFLPQVAYDLLGEHAIIAWTIIMALGGVFAYVFAKMAMLTSDNQGVSLIVGNVLGERYRILAANYLTAAGFFGPVGVALTAADFIREAVPALHDASQASVAAAVFVLCALLVLSGTAAMSKIILVISSVVAVLLLLGSFATLLSLPTVSVPLSLPAGSALGNALLLLFWAIVGWEVLGNYVEDVADPEHTMMRAMKVSLFVIVLVYMVTAFAIQNSHSAAMSNLLIPVFGRFSATIFGLLGAGLCICTVATFTGAVTRQTTARFSLTVVPPILQKRATVVLALLAVNLTVVLLYATGILSFYGIIAAADTMFIANAFLGLFSAFRFMHSAVIRIGIVLLLLMLVLIFVYSSVYALALFAVVTLVSLRSKARQPCTDDARGSA